MADVLVVEAEDLTRRLLGARLTDAGHRVRAVATAAQACELLARAGCPDVLVTDVSLPDGSGLELAARLRAEPGAGDLPVIVLGASAGDGAAGETAGGTADDEAVRTLRAVPLPKPFTAEALAGAFAEALAPVDATIGATVRSRLATFGRLDEFERELIAELLATFVQRAPAVRSAAERAITTGDAEALRSAVGRLKAAALNLGADDLARICADLDAHAGHCPTSLAARFRRVLDATCRVFAALADEYRNAPLDAALVGAGRA